MLGDAKLFIWPKALRQRNVDGFVRRNVQKKTGVVAVIAFTELYSAALATILSVLGVNQTEVQFPIRIAGAEANR